VEIFIVIGKRYNEKKWIDGGKTKKGGNLTVVSFCRQVPGRDGSHMPLFSLLTEGGSWHGCLNSSLIGKRCCEKNIEMLG
jgi:hypothetical protein